MESTGYNDENAEEILEVTIIATDKEYSCDYESWAAIADKTKLSYDSRWYIQYEWRKFYDTLQKLDVRGAEDDVRKAKEATYHYHAGGGAQVGFDFTDFRSIVEGATVYVGVGLAAGPERQGRAETALQVAISDVSTKCDLSETKSIIAMVAAEKVSLFETNDIGGLLRKQLDEGVVLCITATDKEGLGSGNVEVIIIASDKDVL